MDEAVYKNAHEFSPERFLPKPAGNEEAYPVGTFGFGRR
jgi:cytochrome P450